MIPRAMLGYCLGKSVAKDIFELLICIRDFVYPDRKYLWASSWRSMINAYEGNKNQFPGLDVVYKRAVTTLGLV